MLKGQPQEESNLVYYDGEPVYHHVKLPKLVIEKFYGDVSKWQYFWEQFESAVHKNQSLTKTDKFSYLNPTFQALYQM